MSSLADDLTAAPILVVGAGIGGLACALALAKQGFMVHVLERAEALTEVGAGLQLSPNACHCLKHLGCLDQVASASFHPEAIRIRSATSGADIVRLPLKGYLDQKFGAPYLVTHRADLQRILFETAKKHSAIRINFGTTIADLDPITAPNGKSIGTRLTVNSPRGQQILSAPLIIGADGVWSALRQRMTGHANAAFSGRTAYRATLPSSVIPADELLNTGLWLGPKAHLVHYPIRDGREFNLVAIVQEDWTEETWSAAADRTALLQRYGDWPKRAREFLEKPESWLKWALCGVDANAPWTEGRLALLGDAAHGMLPFAAQGAAMAIEDGLVLAAELAKTGVKNVAPALAAYEKRRKPRVTKVQAQARSNGDIYHLKGPMALARNTAMRLAGAHRLMHRQDWIYGWRPDQGI